MRFLLALSLLLPLSPLFPQIKSSPASTQTNQNSVISSELLKEERGGSLPQLNDTQNLKNLVDPLPTSPVSLPPEKSSDQKSDFYSYTQTLEDYRGLQVTAIAGYRIPKESPLEAGFELVLIFQSPEGIHPLTGELEELGNQATVQVYSSRTGLLRYRLVLSQESELNIIGKVSPATQLSYRVTEKLTPFFFRFLNELEGDRVTDLFLSQKNSRDRIRTNFNLNLSPLQDLWHFSQKLKTGEPIKREPPARESGNPPLSPFP